MIPAGGPVPRMYMAYAHVDRSCLMLNAYTNRTRAALAAVMLLAVSLVTSGCSRPGPVETAISFMQAVARGDYDQAIAMIDIPDDVRTAQRELEDSRGKLTSRLSHARDQSDKAGGDSSIEVVSSRALGPDRRGRESMQLSLQVSTKEGKPSGDNIVLVQDDGKWRITL